MINGWSSDIDGIFAIDEDTFWPCAYGAAISEYNSIRSPYGTCVKSRLIERDTCKGEINQSLL
jgi:hypothetical protein